MSLDPMKPTDQVLVSELPSYLRNITVALNNVIDGVSEYTTTDLELPSGTYILNVGTNLASVEIEVVLVKALDPCTIEAITGGTEGQLKVFVAQDNDISFKDGTKEDGKLYLNQLPALSTFDALAGDVLILLNIGGDGATNNGYWTEVLRTVAVK